MVTKGDIVQIIASLFMAIGNLSLSYMMVWPSYTLKIYKSDESPLTGNFTMYHESWVGSVPMLGCLIGTIMGGFIADALGRKRGEILSGLIYLLGSSLQCTLRSINLLIFSRFLIGLGGGLHSGIYSLMVGEFSSSNIRGAVVSISVFGYTTGVLFSYIVGGLCSYDVNNYIYLTMNVLFVLCVSTLKETPIHLLKNGRDKEALKSLKFYRGTKETSQKILDEFSEMKSLVSPPKEMLDMTENGHQDPEKEKLRQGQDLDLELPVQNAWKALRSSKASIRALITCSSLIILVVSMGMSAVQIYAGILFTEAVPEMSSDLCSIALAVANIAGSCLPVFASDYFGRRKLLITSSILVSCCALSLCVFISWPIAPDWMIPAMVLLFCFVFQMGAGSVPFVLNAESYIPEMVQKYKRKTQQAFWNEAIMKLAMEQVSTLCIIISLSMMWVGNFISLAVFGPLVSILTLGGIFFVYAFIAASTAVFTYLIVPETSGLSTEMIQKKFAKGFLQVGRSSNE